MKALLISCFNWYKTRLQPIMELLIQQGYDVTILISDFDHIQKKPLETKYNECTYIHVPSYRSNLSIRRIWSHWYFGRKISEWINDLRPDLIICQIPPNHVGKYCTKYKKQNPNKKLIIDIIDLWPESFPIGKFKNSIPVKKWQKWRDDTIRVSDYVFTECNLYQNRLKTIIESQKTSTLLLFKEQTSEEQVLVEKIIQNRKKDGVIRFAYLGSMNNIIDIEGICRIIRRFVDQGYLCELRAIGNGDNKARFKESVEACGCRAFFYGPIFEERQKIELLAPCDYAFNMMKQNISVGLSIKSIDYLSYGIPIINNIQGDTWEYVDNNPIGINIKNYSMECLPRFDHKQVYSFYTTHFTKQVFINSVSQSLSELTLS